MLLMLMPAVTRAQAADATPPAGPQRVRAERFYPLAMPDGKMWGVSVQALAEGRLGVCAVESADLGRTWGDRRVLVEQPKVSPAQISWGDVVPLLDSKGALHAFILKWDQTKPNAPFPTLAFWHLSSGHPFDRWTEPKLIFDGYIGALLSVVQLKNGTIVAPLAYMTDRHCSKEMPGLMSWVYPGEHTTTAVYSTDEGATFHQSPTPIHVRASIILGNENGTIEPVCLPMKDGRAWMLIMSTHKFCGRAYFFTAKKNVDSVVVRSSLRRASAETKSRRSWTRAMEAA